MQLEVEIVCPNCNRKFKQKVAEMRPGKSRTCPSCGTMIQFTGDDGARAQKAVDDLQKKLKNISRKFGR